MFTSRPTTTLTKKNLFAAACAMTTLLWAPAATGLSRVETAQTRPRRAFGSRIERGEPTLMLDLSSPPPGPRTGPILEHDGF